MTKLIEVYVANGGGDDKGGGQKPVGVCEEEDMAKGMAAGKAFYGGDGHVEKRKALVLEDGRCVVLDRYFPTPVPMNVDMKVDKQERIQAAKDKLTAEELVLLGLV